MTDDRFIERLLELELDARTLQADPRGETWLPADLRALVESDAELGRELDEFVATELALFDGREPSDAFFTKRVMQQLLLGPWLGSAEFGEWLAWSESVASEAGGAGVAIGLLIATAALLVVPLGAGRRAADA
jgi:hypothetical protein